MSRVQGHRSCTRAPLTQEDAAGTVAQAPLAGAGAGPDRYARAVLARNRKRSPRNAERVYSTGRPSPARAVRCTTSSG